MTQVRSLSIADFTYALPEDRIAQRPLADRDASKLLQFKDGRITDHRFTDLPDLLPTGTLLVLNDTKVVNARLVFHRSSGARIEILCLTPTAGRPVEAVFAETGSSEWECFVGNAKRWKEGEVLELNGDGTIVHAERTSPGTVRFTWRPADRSFSEVLERVGHVPLPPYMKRPDDGADKHRYNTVFAQHKGSVAAPTASLHFTPQVLERLMVKGIDKAALTLHVGAGTFLPVKSDTMQDHAMHREQVRIPIHALAQVAERLGVGSIVTVGTTALRTLESVYWHGVRLVKGEVLAEMDVHQWEPYANEEALPSPAEVLAAVITDLRSRGEDRLVGSTELLIAPGYRFRFADGLVTNFHQPQSTLLLLVAAFLGSEWRSVYDHALTHDYRFLSYGDGSLLWRVG